MGTSTPQMSAGLYKVQATRRIFPSTPAPEPAIAKLSIIDATVARFTPTAAIWLYDKSDKVQLPYAELCEKLALALRGALNDYPHFAGQIRWATKEQVKDDLVPRHHGRPVVYYGYPDDPGVELVVVDYDLTLDEVVPSRAERAGALKVWNASGFRQSDFLPDTKIALSSLNSLDGLPCMAVQLTHFKCGGIGISSIISHPLADAVCLMNFMNSWAAKARAFFTNCSATSEPQLCKPIFDPTLLDKVAGLSPGGQPDAAKVEKARRLPMHRFDWWAEEAPGFPAGTKSATLATKPPPEELSETKLSPSTFPPWPTWDMAAAVDHYQIRFSVRELANIKEAAHATLPNDLKSCCVSRLDAVLAHVWTLINRARGHQDCQDDVYMDITLGLRSRLQPPLPVTFVGSPLAIGYVGKMAADVATGHLGEIAGAIRHMMERFTPDAVAAYIHDAAYEVSPQRLWQAFLGTHHTLVTSWVRAKAYELDFFGTGEMARYVQGVMPKIDGLVQIIDVADTGDFDVSLCIQREAMDRLLKDPLLRKYDTPTV